MTEQEFFAGWANLQAAPQSFDDLSRWRHMSELGHRLLVELDRRLREDDEAKLKQLLDAASAISARLGQPVAATVVPVQPRGIACYECGQVGYAHDPSCWKFDPRSETDAGMGCGGGREPDVSAVEFLDELRDIRATNVAKRKQRLAEQGL